MAVEVKTQTSVLWKNSSDYPQYSEFETATIASAKTLAAIMKNRHNKLYTKFQ
jgi:hypothetical protein